MKLPVFLALFPLLMALSACNYRERVTDPTYDWQPIETGDEPLTKPRSEPVADLCPEGARCGK